MLIKIKRADPERILISGLHFITDVRLPANNAADEESCRNDADIIALFLFRVTELLANKRILNISA